MDLVSMMWDELPDGTLLAVFIGLILWFLIRHFFFGGNGGPQVKNQSGKKAGTSKPREDSPSKSFVTHVASHLDDVGKVASSSATDEQAQKDIKEVTDSIEEITAKGAKVAGLADGLVGAFKGEDTEVKAAVGDVAEIGGKLVGALVKGNVTGILDAVESVGDRAQKLNELADELGCGESVGAIAGTVSTVSNILTADHNKSKAVVGQAATEVGSALYGVLSAVGGAIRGRSPEGGSVIGSVLSASADAAKGIGSAITSVAEYTEELGGENNFVSNSIRHIGGLNEAAGVVMAATGKTVTKYMAGEATAADMVALGADCLAGATQGVVAMAGGVVTEMDMTMGAVKLTANLCKAGATVAGHYAKSAGINAGAVDAVVGVVSVATNSVNVAANSVSGVLQATQGAVDVAGGVVVAAGKAAVKVVEDGDTSLSGVMKGVVNEVRENETGVSEAVSGITGTTGAALGTALGATSSVADAVGLKKVGESVGGLLGFGSSNKETGKTRSFGGLFWFGSSNKETGETDSQSPVAEENSNMSASDNLNTTEELPLAAGDVATDAQVEHVKDVDANCVSTEVVSENQDNTNSVVGDINQALTDDLPTVEIKSTESPLNVANCPSNSPAECNDTVGDSQQIQNNAAHPGSDSSEVTDVVEAAKESVQIKVSSNDSGDLTKVAQNAEVTLSDSQHTDLPELKENENEATVGSNLLPSSSVASQCDNIVDSVVSELRDVPVAANESVSESDKLNVDPTTVNVTLPDSKEIALSETNDRVNEALVGNSEYSEVSDVSGTAQESVESPTTVLSNDASTYAEVPKTCSSLSSELGELAEVPKHVEITASDYKETTQLESTAQENGALVGSNEIVNVSAASEFQNSVAHVGSEVSDATEAVNESASNIVLSSDSRDLTEVQTNVEVALLNDKEVAQYEINVKVNEVTVASSDILSSIGDSDFETIVPSAVSQVSNIPEVSQESDQISVLSSESGERPAVPKNNEISDSDYKETTQLETTEPENGVLVLVGSYEIVNARAASKFENSVAHVGSEVSDAIEAVNESASNIVLSSDSRDLTEVQKNVEVALSNDKEVAQYEINEKVNELTVASRKILSSTGDSDFETIIPTSVSQVSNMPEVSQESDQISAVSALSSESGELVEIPKNNEISDSDYKETYQLETTEPENGGLVGSYEIVNVTAVSEFENSVAHVGSEVSDATEAVNESALNVVLSSDSGDLTEVKNNVEYASSDDNEIAQCEINEKVNEVSAASSEILSSIGDSDFETIVPSSVSQVSNIPEASLETDQLSVLSSESSELVEVPKNNELSDSDYSETTQLETTEPENGVLVGSYEIVNASAASEFENSVAHVGSEVSDATEAVNESASNIVLSSDSRDLTEVKKNVEVALSNDKEVAQYEINEKVNEVTVKNSEILSSIGDSDFETIIPTSVSQVSNMPEVSQESDQIGAVSALSSESGELAEVPKNSEISDSDHKETIQLETTEPENGGLVGSYEIVNVTAVSEFENSVAHVGSEVSDATEAVNESALNVVLSSDSGDLTEVKNNVEYASSDDNEIAQCEINEKVNEVSAASSEILSSIGDSDFETIIPTSVSQVSNMPEVSQESDQIGAVSALSSESGELAEVPKNSEISDSDHKETIQLETTEPENRVLVGSYEIVNADGAQGVKNGGAHRRSEGSEVTDLSEAENESSPVIVMSSNFGDLTEEIKDVDGTSSNSTDSALSSEMKEKENDSLVGSYEIVNAPGASEFENSVRHEDSHDSQVIDAHESAKESIPVSVSSTDSGNPSEGSKNVEVVVTLSDGNGTALSEMKEKRNQALCESSKTASVNGAKNCESSVAGIKEEQNETLVDSNEVVSSSGASQFENIVVNVGSEASLLLHSLGP